MLLKSMNLKCKCEVVFDAFVYCGKISENLAISLTMKKTLKLIADNGGIDAYNYLIF
jgi:hypothetical protein